MKTTDVAINKVFSIMKPEVEQPVFRLRKPTKSTAKEYIVINSLPIGKGVMQKCHINVNYHAKDLTNGIPDYEKLESNTASLMTLLEKVDSAGILIDFERQEYIQDASVGEHYSNIRLSVKIVNT